MSGRLLTIGSLLFLVTAALWVADAADWLSDPVADRWSHLTLNAALITMAAGLLVRLLMPVGKVLGGGRCLVCGSRTERGHPYCMDHLQEILNAARDESRSSSSRDRRARVNQR